MWWTSKENKAKRALIAANCRTVQLAYECWRLCVAAFAAINYSNGRYDLEYAILEQQGLAIE